MLMYVSASNIQKKIINKDDINKSTNAKTSGWNKRKEHVPFNDSEILNELHTYIKKKVMIHIYIHNF